MIEIGTLGMHKSNAAGDKIGNNDVWVKNLFIIPLKQAKVQDADVHKNVLFEFSVGFYYFY